MPRSRSRSRGRDDRDRDRRKSRSRSRDRERRREKYRSSRRSRSRSPRGRDRSPIRRRSRDREPRVVDTRPPRDDTRPPRDEQREESPPIGSDEETTIESFGLISKEITVDELAAVEDDDERKMMELMGFGAFDTTKGKRVVGNDHYSAHIVRKRRYRQYMNRRGGFNRPLDFIA